MDFFNLVQSLSSDAPAQAPQVVSNEVEALSNLEPPDNQSASPFAALLDEIAGALGGGVSRVSALKPPSPQGADLLGIDLRTDTVSDADPPEQLSELVPSVGNPDNPLPKGPLDIGMVLPLFPAHTVDGLSSRVEEVHASTRLEVVTGGAKTPALYPAFDSTPVSQSGSRRGPEPETSAHPGKLEDTVVGKGDTRDTATIVSEEISRQQLRQARDPLPVSQFSRFAEQPELANGIRRWHNRKDSMRVSSNERPAPLRALQNIESTVRKLAALPRALESIREVRDKGETPGWSTPNSVLYVADATQASTRTAAAPSVLPQSPVLSSVDQLPEQINLMLSRRAASATLHIEFEDLGRVEIKVRMDSDLAHMNFTVQPAAREAIENYLPRLRALLEDSGLMLGDVDVETASQEENKRETSGSANRIHNRAAQADNEIEEQGSIHKVNASATRHIIDAFA